LQEDEAETAVHLQQWNMGFTIILQPRQLQQQMNDVVLRWGGSVPGKAPNKNCQRDAGTLLLYSDYFVDVQ
jgi:hypothetical protein